MSKLQKEYERIENAIVELNQVFEKTYGTNVRVYLKNWNHGHSIFSNHHVIHPEIFKGLSKAVFGSQIHTPTEKEEYEVCYEFNEKEYTYKLVLSLKGIELISNDDTELFKFSEISKFIEELKNKVQLM